MNSVCVFHLQTPIPNTQIPLKCFKQPTTPILASTRKVPPARDRVIDFGKHKGQMLGTLPSSYLKWVSKNLRARDFEDWAKLADQVLQDPVYQDRLEWEFAQNALDGNRTNSSSGVSDLLEISERFGWNNEDKLGWSKVDIELLGTSKSGRIPRVGKKDGGKRERKEKLVEGEIGGGGGGRRSARRERVRLRLRMKREEDESRIVDKSRGNLGKLSAEEKGVGVRKKKKKEAGEIYNPFPGREALLNKVVRQKRFL